MKETKSLCHVVLMCVSVSRFHDIFLTIASMNNYINDVVCYHLKHFVETSIFQHNIKKESELFNTQLLNHQVLNCMRTKCIG